MFLSVYQTFVEEVALFLNGGRASRGDVFMLCPVQEPFLLVYCVEGCLPILAGVIEVFVSRLWGSYIASPMSIATNNRNTGFLQPPFGDQLLSIGQLVVAFWFFT